MQLSPDWIDRRPDDSEGETLNNQLSTINCFNEERHLSETCALALYERPIKREAKFAYFLLLNWYFLLRTFF
jgi:hypothetical protein